MTVIALDNRGMGKSSRPDEPYTVDTFVEDTKDLLKYLNIQEPIHICGFSNGGAIAQSFALKYPRLVKSLMLFGTATYMPPVEFEQQLKLLDKVFKNATQEEIIQMAIPSMFSPSFRKKLKTDKELFELYKNDMGLIAHIKDPPRYQDYVNQWTAMKGYDTREILHKITQPTLIIVGSRDKDNLRESEFMHQKIPNSTFEVLEGIGHAFIIEAPEKTNEIMWNFLKKHLN